MSTFLPGLPDLIALRQIIEDTLVPTGLLGTYTFPDGSTDQAIAVEGLGNDDGEESYPPAGTQVVGLEVVMVPAEDVQQQSFLDGDGIFFQTTIILKQHDSGSNKTLKAYLLLSSQFGNIYEGSVSRILPTPRLDNIETLSFSLETSVLMEFEGTLAVIDDQPNSSVIFTFSQAELTLNKIVLTHGLGKQPVDVSLFDQSNYEIYPYDVRSLSPNEVEIDLTGLTPITGTWRALIER